MYELQSTLAAYARRKFSSGEISVDHLKNILKVSIILKILKLYHTYLKIHYDQFFYILKLI